MNFAMLISWALVQSFLIMIFSPSLLLGFFCYFGRLNSSSLTGNEISSLERNFGVLNTEIHVSLLHSDQYGDDIETGSETAQGHVVHNDEANIENLPANNDNFPGEYLMIQIWAGLFINGFSWVIVSDWDYYLLNAMVDMVQGFVTVIILTLFCNYIGYYPALKCKPCGLFCLPTISVENIRGAKDLGIASSDQWLGVPLTWVTAVFCFMPRRVFESLDLDRQMFIALFTLQNVHCLGLFKLPFWLYHKCRTARRIQE